MDLVSWELSFSLPERFREARGEARAELPASLNGSGRGLGWSHAPPRSRVRPSEPYLSASQPVPSPGRRPLLLRPKD
eukprot:366357-Chlamydomonas_euryale.AAC.7